MGTSVFPFRSLDDLLPTTLRHDNFKNLLISHPDQHWVHSILLPIVHQDGARILCYSDPPPYASKARKLDELKSGKLFESVVDA